MTKTNKKYTLILILSACSLSESSSSPSSDLLNYCPKWPYHIVYPSDESSDSDNKSNASNARNFEDNESNRDNDDHPTARSSGDPVPDAAFSPTRPVVAESGSNSQATTSTSQDPLVLCYVFCHRSQIPPMLLLPFNFNIDLNKRIIETNLVLKEIDFRIPALAAPLNQLKSIGYLTPNYYAIIELEENI